VTFAAPAGSTCDALSGAFFPVGTTIVTCTAGALSCSFDVTVNDVEAPSVGASTAPPNVLWPPNNRMVDVTLSYSGTDNCGPASCSIVSVTRNESGVADDAQIVDAHHVRLRARAPRHRQRPHVHDHGRLRRRCDQSGHGVGNAFADEKVSR
jgi:hypothetical protein